MSVKAAIDEWEERNEAARFKDAKEALSSDSTQDIILIYQRYASHPPRKPYNMV